MDISAEPLAPTSSPANSETDRISWKVKALMAALCALGVIDAIQDMTYHKQGDQTHEVEIKEEK